jgi:hypothetical protein
METTHAVAQTMEISPRSPDGILDMIGPRTLDGGYSPSHDISSAMARVVFGRDWVEVMIGDVVRERVGFGAKAVEMAMIAARMRRESLAILIYISVVLCCG